ncbi:MAG TPA: SpaA isopeptide-forming pilin-related protein, partial [Candidatus Lumbricidophila sp.]|nr:SpaA isopeptide-forming pilin-related protein [Candidatus Lumbricidophila sp.]
MSIAQAAVAPVVFNNIQVSGTPPKQVGDRFTLSIDWRVADRAAHAGDTFQVPFDPAFSGIPQDFDLKSPAGDVIANCSVVKDLLTCTFTSFVDSHINVQGNFTFEAKMVAVPSNGNQLNVGGTTITLQEPVAPAPSGGSSGPPSVTPIPEFKKTGWVDYDQGVLHWQVQLPKSVLVDSNGNDVTFTDTYDARLGAPSSFDVRWTTGRVVGQNGGVGEGTAPGKFSVVSDAASHSFTFTYHNAAALGDDQFLTLQYTQKIPTGTRSGASFSNTFASTDHTDSAQLQYTVTGGGNGTGNTNGQVSVTKVDKRDSSRKLAGAVFEVRDANGAVVATLPATDANGEATSGDIAPGNYTLVETVAPAGYVLDSTPHAVTISGGSTTPVTVEDAAAKVSVGNLVWVDSNDNGIQDAGEPGLGGVTLTITGPNGAAVTNVNGAAVTTTTTDANGAYSFTDLPVLPAG